jgi:hypothetical protein
MTAHTIWQATFAFGSGSIADSTDVRVYRYAADVAAAADYFCSELGADEFYHWQEPDGAVIVDYWHHADSEAFASARLVQIAEVYDVAITYEEHGGDGFLHEWRGPLDAACVAFFEREVGATGSDGEFVWDDPTLATLALSRPWSGESEGAEQAITVEFRLRLDG